MNGGWPVGATPDPRWSLGILAGVRYTDSDIKIDFGSGGSAETGDDWFDPFAGARVEVDLNTKWKLVGSADFGGFGIGSDFTWNAWGTLAYQWRENKRIYVGYRGLHQDFESGSGREKFGWDVTFHGPIASFEFTF